MRVMIIGAGGQGAPGAVILVNDPDVEYVKLCDISESVLENVKMQIALRKDLKKLETKKIDAKDIEAVASEASNVDIIFDFTSPEFCENILKAAAIANVYYVNSAWDEWLYEDFYTKGVTLTSKIKYHYDFERNGKAALLGCGISPGFGTNILIAHSLRDFESVESIKIRLGKKNELIPTDYEMLVPWNPGWNTRQAVADFTTPSYKMVDGELTTLIEPFSEPEMWNFPEPVGMLLVTHHAHEEAMTLPIKFQSKGLKYCDFKYFVNKQCASIISTGLGSNIPVEINGQQVKPIDVLDKVVQYCANDAFLSETPENLAERDKTEHITLVNEIIGVKNGKKVRITIGVPSLNIPHQEIYDTYGTSIVYVALPMLIGAKVLMAGNYKGIIQPEDLDSDLYIELLEKSGLKKRWTVQEEEIE